MSVKKNLNLISNFLINGLYIEDIHNYEEPRMGWFQKKQGFLYEYIVE
jgi:hypothetical protein